MRSKGGLTRKNKLRPLHPRLPDENDMPRYIPAILAATLLLPLAACGRKAALDAPNAIPPANGEKAPPAEPVEDKPFILDGLIR